MDYLDESTLFEISWPGKQKVAASSRNTVYEFNAW